tara:strand:- start:831 stop:1595 length:765 start_codon:yes stop_codon:yes gene_type:complete
MSKKKNKEPDFPENGFVIVASRLERFYIAAVELAKSIKLFWPEAHITIYVDNEDWIKPSHWYECADWIVHWDVPNHIRAKLWALGQTPYKGITCYLDADMDCQHEDIQNIFEQLPDDLDLLFSKIRPYNAKVTKLTNTEEMTAHCGMFLYRNKPEVIKLMNAWWGDYVKQREQDDKGNFVEDIGDYPNSIRQWDTFTMWKLLTYGDHDVKWADDLHCRWNFINGTKPEELEGDDIVLYHYTIPRNERNEIDRLS